MNRLRKKQLTYTKRRQRVRKKVVGTGERPRLSVFRSVKHIYAQLVDDEKGITLVAASTQSPDVREQLTYTGNVNAAKIVGAAIARKALDKSIASVVFDRGGNLYHGRIKALAEAAREGGLKF